jgi:hypothetical protein
MLSVHRVRRSPFLYLACAMLFTVSAGLWALGAFVFTVLAKAAIPVELNHLRRDPHRADHGAP